MGCSCIESADRKRGQRKGPRQKKVRDRQKVSKIVSTLFDIFRAGQKSSKIVKNRQKVSKTFSTLFDNFCAAPVFGASWGALIENSASASNEGPTVLRSWNLRSPEHSWYCQPATCGVVGWPFLWLSPVVLKSRRGHHRTRSHPSEQSLNKSSVELKLRLQGYGYSVLCSHRSRCLEVLI